MHLPFLILLGWFSIGPPRAAAAEVDGVTAQAAAEVAADAADGAAPGAEETDAPEETPAAPKQRVHDAALRPFLYGLLGLESALYSRDIDLKDVIVVNTEFSERFDAPRRTVREARDRRWRKHFGSARISATRQRLADGATVDAASAPIAPALEDRGGIVCADMEGASGFPWELATWDDATRGEVADADLQRRPPTPPLFLAQETDKTTAFVHLTPGEAVTLVELDEGAKKAQRVRRRLTFRGDKRRLFIQEDDDTQYVCVSILPPERYLLSGRP